MSISRKHPSKVRATWLLPGWRLSPCSPLGEAPLSFSERQESRVSSLDLIQELPPRIHRPRKETCTRHQHGCRAEPCLPTPQCLAEANTLLLEARRVEAREPRDFPREATLRPDQRLKVREGPTGLPELAAREDPGDGYAPSIHKSNIH